MINEFSRTELLIGQDSMERLKSTTVMVFGVGGVGSPWQGAASGN